MEAILTFKTQRLLHEPHIKFKDSLFSPHMCLYVFCMSLIINSCYTPKQCLSPVYVIMNFVLGCHPAPERCSFAWVIKENIEKLIYISSQVLWIIIKERSKEE